MLDAFILEHRDTILARARARVATRASPKPTDVELKNGIPVFLDQLGTALRLAEVSDDSDHRAIRESAGLHGIDLLEGGLSIAQVVHDYGDVCQTVTELAIELAVPLTPHEFQVLNLCLDDAIAEAVTRFAARRERAITDRGTERLGELAHELRNRLNTATLSFQTIRDGRVPANGSTGAVLARSLVGLRDLIDRSLADVRVDAGIYTPERFLVSSFVEELEIGGTLLAQSRALHFSVASVTSPVSLQVDRQILAGALSNLLGNAFKFTHRGGHVSLTVQAIADRVRFDVEDECGGLPPGSVEGMFRPFEQHSADRSGVGLGLAICHKAAVACGGDLRVRDLPGKGCVFTLELPAA
jgi:signal transduction histidine kinase